MAIGLTSYIFRIQDSPEKQEFICEWLMGKNVRLAL